MKGHDAIIAARRRGLVPPSVFLDANPCGLWRQHTGHVELGESESVGRADLRFVVGLLVFVEGHDEQRVKALAHRCIEHGARRVVAFVGKAICVHDKEGSIEWHP